MGLRWKSGLWLGTLFALVLLFALLVGRIGLDAFRDHYGAGFARNHALLQAQKLVTLLTRELSLSQRLAEIGSIRRFLRDGADAAAAFADLEQFRRAFVDQSVFLIADASGDYYFNDGSAPPGALPPRYSLSADEPKDGWYFATIRDGRPFALNVNVDDTLAVTKVWFNVVVREDARVLGLAGTGLDLTRFLGEFVASADSGITNFIIDGDGAILAHPDASLIEYAALTKTEPQRTLARLIGRDDEREALRQALAAVRAAPAGGATVPLNLLGAPRTLGIAYIAELDWYAVTAVDLGAARVLDENVVWPVALGGIVLLLIFATAATLGVDRFILRPLQQLNDSARRIAAGDYAQQMGSPRRDELGELTRVFDAMAREVRSHTAELEHRVADRTRDLAQAHDRIAAAHHQIQDSIRYASLIQEAMLPRAELARHLPAAHFVLWQPRDVVGGDCYLLRAHGQELLVGVVDCAGHGVPGAIMTMIAHAAFDIAVHELGLRDPAALLGRMDAAARALLPTLGLDQRLATNMDVGLCHIDAAAGRMSFAGARMAVYRCDGTRCEEIPGSRRSLGERRRATWDNVVFATGAGDTYYLATDGFLDQSGGERGYGFGKRRFAALLAEVATLPIATQGGALSRALADYQGPRTQRDDITVLGFRIPRRASPAGHTSGE